MGTMIGRGTAVTANSTTTLATGIFDNVATTGSGATPTPTATNTPLPTNTPTATNTPVSTNTPTPTYTPTPSPTPAPDVWIKRSSYGIAGQMVAFRVTGDPANSGLFYVLSDHLGSTSLLVNSSGSTVTGSTTRYLPFGGYRGTAPSQSITDRDFTGQKENRELGLLYYQARFYVPGIGRFASADTLVPDPGNPQAYNRYSYVENRPLNFTDPSGHIPCEEMPIECEIKHTAFWGHGVDYEDWTVGSIDDTNAYDDHPWAAQYYRRIEEGVLSVPNGVTAEQFVGQLVAQDVLNYSQNDYGRFYNAMANIAIAEAAVLFYEMLVASDETSAQVYSYAHAGGDMLDELPPTSIDDAFSNPNSLFNRTPSDVQGVIDEAVNSGNWTLDTLSRGSRAGEGMVLRELNVNGDLTGRMVQWHPGGGHHGATPYWKVSSPQNGTIRIGPQFPK